MEMPLRFFPLDRIRELEIEIAAGLQAHSLWARRDAIAVALGLHGLRVGEVCGARAEHFRPEHRRLWVATLKGGRCRDLPLHDSVIAALQWWRDQVANRLGHRPPWLLSSRRGNRLNPQRPQQAAAVIFRRLLGPRHGRTFHSLRHTFAMQLYSRTLDIFLVKRMMGHASIKSTEIYVQALAAVPDDCLVHLDHVSMVPEPYRLPGCQLHLYDPAAG